jgi:hypothetical protein
MRLWSLHPKYLDSKGLVAVWREALLAKNVLEGKTKGYKHHPQLNRFIISAKPIDAINQYLLDIHKEAKYRNYNFNYKKINLNFEPTQLIVTIGQLEYEAKHLLSKLKIRSTEKYIELKSLKTFIPHPLFNIVPGDRETWEIIK